MSVLSLSNITKSFGSNDILKGVSLEAEPGEFIALVGPSGCGKSTLLRIVAGLDHADQGEISLGGKTLSNLTAADRNIAMVFQSYALYPHLTAGQNIAVPLAMRRLTATQRLPIIGNVLPGQKAIRQGILKEVEAMAASLKIGHLLNRKPGQMSGGQRQRVALARAMVRHPALFLMDEPLSNLDANLRVHARGEIVELHRKSGVPALYVTHDQSEALSMASRVAVMIGGRLLQLATPQTIYEDPSHIEVARFIGQPRINLLPTKATANGMVQFGGITIAASSLSRGDDITVGIRPEFVRLASQSRDTMAATVERLEFLGSEVILFARLDGMGETVVVKLTPSDAANLGPGKPVHLAIQPDKALLFGADGERVTTQVSIVGAPELLHG
ncbi:MULTISPECIES: ABC transporter ATP-binding protein [unclassified Rhizobium]|uniref:ABC transporter ATP-binding protein n=1 Tax=unclassified Rhizobium TaxID=2613769 RepID=UPI001784A514|nr:MULTISPECIES: ABC transporter ATP-binding protein [unclassified Rhizobium]MBD8688350.1 ABC transporter ATP-binding protein [Rhizobium sp. CFBP 13644]MBD8692805.1 ABC transporter ATP-binding protein [Rhizobium sp. CFBP 13717]